LEPEIIVPQVIRNEAACSSGAYAYIVMPPWPEMQEYCHFVMANYSCQDHARFPYFLDIKLPHFIRRAAPRRQAEFVAGRFCAREALHRLTGKIITPGYATDRTPIWPYGIVGSISHSHGHAIAVVASCTHYQGIGVDVERILTEEEIKDIAPQILTENEMQTLSRSKKTFPVSLAFSAKESLFKALYPMVQKFQNFYAAELVFDELSNQVRLQLTIDWSNQWRLGTKFDVYFHHFNGFILTCITIPHSLPSSAKGNHHD